MFKPSIYQEKIFEWFQSGVSNAAVNAVAGSGKTTSIVEGLKVSANPNTLFAAFNKSIVEELKRRLPASVNVQTIHSLGYQTLRNGVRNIQKWDIDDTKYRVMAKGLRLSREHGDPEVFKDSLLSLIRFAQATLCQIDSESLASVAEKFSVEIPPCGIDPIAEAVSLFLEEGIRQAKEEGKISFGDMLWVPAHLGLQPAAYSLVCVDEAQDLSYAQMALVKGAVNGAGRVVSVGDPKQAIYGFAGASHNSFYELVEHFAADQLPLSICYRCPSAVLDRARMIVPQIEAAPDAPAGVVDTIKNEQFKSMIRTGDMILCRTTAPLIKLCFQLIGERKQARIKGRDIGAQLTNTVKAICSMRGNSWDNFTASLDRYRDHQLGILRQKIGTEGQQESVNDRCDAIEVCYGSFLPSSKEQFISDIEGLFCDQRAAITLSTVHRAKGLENSRVFIIYPEKLPLVWKNQTASQAEQEMNLRYVAITRAQSELYFVKTEKEG